MNITHANNKNKNLIAQQVAFIKTFRYDYLSSMTPNTGFITQ